jgi:predicted CXXCH cytochrome family protein
VKTQRLLVTLIAVLGCGLCFGKDSCFECHLIMEGMSHTFTNDIHFSKSVSCATCHGGDPQESDQNISMNASRGFKVRATRQAIPEYCGRCHSDTNLMSKYDPPPRTDVVAKYSSGIHGKLLAAGRRRAAQCVDCHSIHDIRPPSDPLSKASPQRITQTCAKCHEAVAQAFVNTRHGRMFNNPRRPGCTVCHSSHDTAPATTAMLTGSTSICTPCHRAGSGQARLAAQMASFLAELEAAGPDSKEALDRARIAVHTMNLAAIRRAAEPPPAPAKADEK